MKPHPPQAHLGLYVHIPYCIQRCGYCDFFTKPLSEEASRLDSFQRLLQALRQELRQQASHFAGRPLRSIFFGGGTPSLLEPHETEDILVEISRHFAVEEGWEEVEITLEVNPETMDSRKAKALRELGINRLSIGVQSLDPESLRLLGRAHTVKKAKECYLLARDAGFANINLDLIYGRPHQTLALWEKELDEILEWKPEHLSMYELILEPGTPMTRAVKNGTLCLPEEEVRLAMYRLAREKTQADQMHWYEVSNYARPGFESRHNLDNWRGAEYLGIGPGAHSFGQLFAYGARRANPRNMPLYLEDPGAAPWVERTYREACFESLLNGLRLIEGFRPSSLSLRYPFELSSAHIEKLQTLEQQGYLLCEDDLWQLTPRGLELLDSILVYLESSIPSAPPASTRS